MNINDQEKSQKEKPSLRIKKSTIWVFALIKVGHRS